ncbi:MAG: hypothetical protein ACR2QE_21440 [Acidimicrobiales bacterium]
MEGRQPVVLHLEMSDLTADSYMTRRQHLFDGGQVTLFVNQHRDRADLPRTLPEFDLLAVHELDRSTPLPPPDDALVGSFRFERTPRPGQGSLSPDATTGLQLVLISAKDPACSQELRDWGDHVHIRHIAEAAVPGFGMITPYRNAGEGPTFLHFYEMHTTDPEAAFQSMTPLVADRMGGTDSKAYRDWAWHPQLQIDYVNTFARIG